MDGKTAKGNSDSLLACTSGVLMKKYSVGIEDFVKTVSMTIEIMRDERKNEEGRKGR
jgi:hypothetical protein